MCRLCGVGVGRMLSTFGPSVQQHGTWEGAVVEGVLSIDVHNTSAGSLGNH